MPYLPGVGQDRLVRKEVALGLIRDLPVNTQHIGLTIAPFKDVASDDVVFDYIANTLTEGLAPARAEDAEAELAQKDEFMVGYGRASIMDWAVKDHYSASDVTRYTEALYLQAQAGGNPTVSFPLTINSITDGFQDKIARDAALRRKKLDNRIEWLIMTSIEAGILAYNDGKIKFTVDWQRPADQTDEAPATGVLWSASTSDPIRDVLAVKQFMKDRYGIQSLKAITSERVMNNVMNSDKFVMAVTNGNTNIDPFYGVAGWGPEAAMAILTRATQVQFQAYDAVYRTRPIGSQTITNNRFTSDNKIYFLPSDADVNEIDDAIGFAKTLTSPHPEGNWTPSFYEWEQETRDPWGRDVGTGIKAFPVFTHMDMTYTLVVL